MIIKLNEQDYNLLCQLDIERFRKICKIQTFDGETEILVEPSQKQRFQLILSDEIWRNGMDDNDNATQLGYQLFALQDKILKQISIQ